MKPMKKTMMLLMAAASLATVGRAELTPEEILQAVDQMTPEQANAFSQKLEAKLWQPVPQGFFSRMAVDVGMTAAQMDSIKFSGVTMSGGERDLEEVSGVDVGILWQVFHPQCRVGLRLGNWASADSQLEDAGYTRAELTGTHALLAWHQQWMRREGWLAWTEIGAGGAYVSLDTIDTPTGAATTLREFDQSYGVADVLAGVSWRFNRALCLQLAGGYRFAESTRLDEGGRTSPVELDGSGPVARLGLGVNY